MKYPFETI